jgi:uncharacterized surface protein with fasciclin (FAS1) repeats
MKKVTLALLVLCAPSAFASDDVVVAAQKAGNTLFHDAVVAAGLYEHAKKDVGQDGSLAPFTVFVPNNGAFTQIKGLAPEKQKELITFHVAPGRKVTDLASELASGIPTVGNRLLQGSKSEVHLEESDVKAAIVSGPHEARNGVFYVIDKVLQQKQQEAVSSPTLHTSNALPAPAKNEKATAEAKPEGMPAQHVAQAQVVAPAPLTEETGKELLNAVTQLTSTMQLLTHVVQQAQSTAFDIERSEPKETLIQQIPQVGVKQKAVTE